MNTEFIYEQNYYEKVMKQMDKRQRKIFPIDVNDINWKLAANIASYGIKRYFGKEDCLAPNSGFQ